MCVRVCVCVCVFVCERVYMRVCVCEYMLCGHARMHAYTHMNIPGMFLAISAPTEWTPRLKISPTHPLGKIPRVLAKISIWVEQRNENFLLK